MNTTGFDPYEWHSFFIPGISREEATKLLSEPIVEIGTFLLRESSRAGDYSLTVRESNDGNIVRHYLIQHEQGEDGSNHVKIAEQTFSDIPLLLNHFKMRVLDQTSLLYPYKKPTIQTVIGTFKFTAERETDLSFDVGEKLDIISKTDKDWWEARNALGNTGQIPANYVVAVNEYTGERASKGTSQSSIGSSDGGNERFSSASMSSDANDTNYQPRLPAVAKVVHDRLPNAYDPTQLRIKKGQIVKVIEKLTNGMYRAELEGISGIVPFTYIKFIRSQE